MSTSKTFEDQDLDQLESDKGVFVVLEDHSEDRFEVLAKASIYLGGSTAIRAFIFIFRRQATACLGMIGLPDRERA